MNNFQIKCCSALLAAIPAACAGNYQVGDAIVTDRGGSPCFLLSNADLAEKIEAISVYDSTTSPPHSVWRVLANKDSKLSPKPENCILYGTKMGTWSVNSEFSSKAQALKARTIYEVVIIAPREGGNDPIHHYRAKFCLTQNSTNESNLEVHQILWSAKDQRWDFGACEG